MRKIALLFLALLFVGTAYGADSSLFATANAKYQAGDFKGAAQLYRNILDAKGATAAVYYNLGNTMLRLGNKGQALVYYKRALAITPRDGDVQWNLRVLKGALPDRLEEASFNFMRFWISKALDFFTVDEIALILLGCVGSLFLLSVLLCLSPAARSWAGSFQVLFIIGLIASAVLLNLKWHQMKEPQVVVLDREVVTRNGPSSEESKAFLLHEGAEGKVIDESKDWYYIVLANKSTGWIPKESCEVV